MQIQWLAIPQPVVSKKYQTDEPFYNGNNSCDLDQSV